MNNGYEKKIIINFAQRSETSSIIKLLSLSWVSKDDIEKKFDLAKIIEISVMEE